MESGPVTMEISVCIEETHEFNLVNDQSEELFQVKKERGMTFLSKKLQKGHTLQSRISNLGAKLVRHHDQEERETGGVVQWKSIGPKLRDVFQRTHSLIQLASSMFQKGAKNNRFQHCKISHDVLLKIRAIPGHTGANAIALELMGHVAIPSRWKEFPFHRGCSFDVTSITEHDSSQVERERKGDKRSSSHARRRIQQGRIEAEKSTLSWQMEASSGRLLSDPLS